jgi:hypothetical protein
MNSTWQKARDFTKIDDCEFHLRSVSDPGVPPATGTPQATYRITSGRGIPPAAGTSTATGHQLAAGTPSAAAGTPPAARTLSTTG